jgi:hypothetical protein
MFSLVTGKLNLSYFAQGGYIHNFSGRTLHTNDRLFLQKTHVFRSIGHVEPSNEPIDAVSIQSQDPKDAQLRKVILGDDLGAEAFLSVLGRLEFCDVPTLKNYGVKPFVFGEFVYYPPMAATGRQHCRGGMGFGISIPLPINDMLSLQIYHNALILNANPKGDIARTSKVEIEIGFF